MVGRSSNDSSFLEASESLVSIPRSITAPFQIPTSHHAPKGGASGGGGVDATAPTAASLGGAGETEAAAAGAAEGGVAGEEEEEQGNLARGAAVLDSLAGGPMWLDAWGDEGEREGRWGGEGEEGGGGGGDGDGEGEGGEGEDGGGGEGAHVRGSADGAATAVDGAAAGKRRGGTAAAIVADLGLWAVYARLEAECGNLDASRKVLDTALASVAALPKSAAEATPLLVLAYTHIQLSPTSHSTNQHRNHQQQQRRPQSSKGHMQWTTNQHWCSLHTLASFAASAPFSAPPPLPPQLDPSGLEESWRTTTPSSRAVCKYFPQAALIRARAGFHLKLQEAKKFIAASAAAAAAAASASLPTFSTNPSAVKLGASTNPTPFTSAVGDGRLAQAEESSRATAAVAVVLCACLFELLAAPSLPEGVAATAAVVDGCIAAVLPGRRACCLPLELLFERYASLLLHALPAIPSQQVRRVVLQGLKEFPSNVHLLGTFLRLESRSAFTNSIRRFFDQTTASLLVMYLKTSNPPPSLPNHPLPSLPACPNPPHRSSDCSISWLTFELPQNISSTYHYLPPLQTTPPLTTPLAAQSPG
ncbi:unnamed protein product [Closterium sp. Naga37s-1]|nr:unnamed protein product [Closterium sp. Naga37s-1]